MIHLRLSEMLPGHFRNPDCQRSTNPPNCTRREGSDRRRDRNRTTDCSRAGRSHSANSTRTGQCMHHAHESFVFFGVRSQGCKARDSCWTGEWSEGAFIRQGVRARPEAASNSGHMSCHVSGRPWTVLIQLKPLVDLLSFLQFVKVLYAYWPLCNMFALIHGTSRPLRPSCSTCHCSFALIISLKSIFRRSALLHMRLLVPLLPGGPQPVGPVFLAA